VQTIAVELVEDMKAVCKVLVCSVETVTPLLAEGILANTETGAKITWLTEDKIQERFNSEEYLNRDLFSRYGL
jgi:hypothetical protein